MCSPVLYPYSRHPAQQRDCLHCLMETALVYTHERYFQESEHWPGRSLMHAMPIILGRSCSWWGAHHLMAVINRNDELLEVPSGILFQEASPLDN